MKRVLLLSVCSMVLLTACSKPKTLEEPVIEDIPIVEESTVIEEASAVTLESTYGDRVVTLEESRAVEEFMTEYIDSVEFRAANPAFFKVDKWLTGIPKDVVDLHSPASKAARAIACIHLMDCMEGYNSEQGTLRWEDLTDLCHLFGFEGISEFWLAWDVPNQIVYGEQKSTSFQSQWSPDTGDYFFNEPGDTELLGEGDFKLARDEAGHVLFTDGCMLKTLVGDYWVVVPGLKPVYHTNTVFIDEDVCISADWLNLCRDVETYKTGDDIPYVIINEKFAQTMSASDVQSIQAYIDNVSDYDWVSVHDENAEYVTMEELADKYCK